MKQGLIGGLVVGLILAVTFIGFVVYMELRPLPQQPFSRFQEVDIVSGFYSGDRGQIRDMTDDGLYVVELGAGGEAVISGEDLERRWD